MKWTKEFLHRIHLRIFLGCFINQDVTFWDYPMEKIKGNNSQTHPAHPKLPKIQE